MFGLSFTSVLQHTWRKLSRSLFLKGSSLGKPNGHISYLCLFLMGSFLRTGPDSKGAASYALEREREREYSRTTKLGARRSSPTPLPGTERKTETERVKLYVTSLFRGTADYRITPLQKPYYHGGGGACGQRASHPLSPFGGRTERERERESSGHSQLLRFGAFLWRWL